MKINKIKMLTKRNIKTSVLTLLLIPFLVSCGPAFLKKMISDNPDIVIDSIKENPDKYMEALAQAQQAYTMKRRKKQRQNEQTEREEEFQNPKQPDVSGKRVWFGDKNAPITIVEYSDFQCGFCGRASKTVEKILKDYKGKVRVLYKHLPLPSHPQAMIAAQYYEAVGRQDSKKAKMFHDKIFAKQGDLSKGEPFLKGLAGDLSVDMKQLQRDLKKVEEVVRKDSQEASQFGFSGTPGFLVGGVSVAGAFPYPHFKEIIDRHLDNIAKKKGEK